MIPFNKPAVTGNELEYIRQAMASGKISGDGHFTRRCQAWFEQRFGVRKALLTTSCTDALEMAAILADIREGDEVIMPSYTFVSTANAFALRGARIVFVDIRPDTMNIDERLIEAAVTPKTRAIVPVHYAGVACEMDAIMAIAERHGLLVIEDAAQGVMSAYKGRPLGAIGHFGCYSFHETKNYNSGEGGALTINDARFVERAEIIWEKGTNRARFFRGEVDKYSWVDIGSSFLPSELNAAFLYAQLEQADAINERRLDAWQAYYNALRPLQDEGLLEVPVVPPDCRHNGHMFYLKTAGLDERTRLIDHLKRRGVMAIFHYVPLHSAEAGRALGGMAGEDRYTTAESERLVRLPMYDGLTLDEIETVVGAVKSFYQAE